MIDKPMTKEETSELIRKAMGGTPTAEIIEATARRWQNEAFSHWLGLPDDERRMTVKAATGAGKTRLAIMCILEHIRTHGDNGVVVFAVPSKDLVQQTGDVLRGFSIRYARVSSQYGNEYMLKRPVYITTYHSLDKVSNNKHVVGKNILFIGDECHKIGATRTRQRLAHFQGDACLLLSATPRRGDGLSVMQIMNAPIRYTLKLVDGIAQSRSGSGELDYTIHHVALTLTPSEQFHLSELDSKIRTLKYRALGALKELGRPCESVEDIMLFSNADVEEVGHYKAKTMERKRAETKIADRMSAIIALLRMHVGKKFVIFHESIIGLEIIAQLCRDEGINPHIYHSGLELSQDDIENYPDLITPDLFDRLHEYKKNANKHLTRWKESSSDFLLTCKALKEGFDAPDMDGVVMVSGTNATRSRIQTIGRVFRGSSHKDIYYFVSPSASSDRNSGDESSFHNVMRESGMDYNKVKYTSTQMLETFTASVSHAEIYGEEEEEETFDIGEFIFNIGEEE